MTGVERQAVVDEARSWVGTPYTHQASAKGAGCDCLGLLRGVWRAVVGDEPLEVPEYTPDWSEPEGAEALWDQAKAVLRPGSVHGPLPGDVLLFRMRRSSVAKHLGILSVNGTHPKFIHAYSGHGVVESSFGQPWQRRLVSHFSFPERRS